MAIEFIKNTQYFHLRHQSIYTTKCYLLNYYNRLNRRRRTFICKIGFLSDDAKVKILVSLEFVCIVI